MNFSVSVNELSAMYQLEPIIDPENDIKLNHRIPFFIVLTV